MTPELRAWLDERRDLLADMGPNSVYTGREVMRLLASIFVEEGEHEVSTVQASELLGHGSAWWAGECRAGHIPNARQPGGPGSMWYLPLREAREHLANLRKQGKARERTPKRFGRTPWKAQAA